MRYFIEMAYRGEPYHGWQRQPNAISVQQVVEKNLSCLLHTDTSVTGAGRTDTGVNARRYFAHFDTDTLTMSQQRLAASLNNMCGRSITVSRIFPVEAEIHARYSALYREYRYFIHCDKDPFIEPLSTRLASLPDIRLMNDAAEIMMEYNDFTSFAKLHSDSVTNLCSITRAKWHEATAPTGTRVLMFRIRADRFLRNMVRAIVGTLLHIGSRHLPPDSIRDIIEAKDRCAAGTSVPPQALFLWDVGYPTSVIPSQN